MDRFEEMRNFVRIVDAGSITRAADTTHIAKSAISRRLAELEDRLNVQLINRTTRRMTLTDAGRRFYDECQRLLGDLEEVEGQLNEAETSLTGRIRLAAPSAFGLAHLTPAITEFAKLHPGLKFEIDFNDRHIDLIEEGFDLALRISKLADSRMMARRLAPVGGLVLASPSYWDKHGRPKKPEDLQKHPCIEYSYRGYSGWRYESPRGKTGSVRINEVMSANHANFIRDAAIAGLGIVLQPTFICNEAIEQGLLEPVLTQYRWIDLELFAIYPNTRHLPNRIRVFIDYLVGLWGDDPYWDECFDC
ncbi:MAG: LysR family transcriptional regulator [Gammaproteobacteria bacterium]